MHFPSMYLSQKAMASALFRFALERFTIYARSMELKERSMLMEHLELHARTLLGIRPQSVWSAEMAQHTGVKMSGRSAC